MRDAYLVVLEAGGGNLALDNVVLQDIRQLGGVLGQQQGVQGRLGHFGESLSEIINKHWLSSRPWQMDSRKGKKGNFKKRHVHGTTGSPDRV
jgi:hypothetical protein